MKRRDCEIFMVFNKSAFGKLYILWKNWLFLEIMGF